MDGPDEIGGDDKGDATGSYSVEMAPVGKIPFDPVPERWLAYESGYADMGVALGGFLVLEDDTLVLESATK